MKTLSELISQHINENSVTNEHWEDYETIVLPPEAVVHQLLINEKILNDPNGGCYLNKATGEITIDMKDLVTSLQMAQGVINNRLPAMGNLVYKMRPIYTFHVDTQATDGYNWFINPCFTAQLTYNERIFVMLHELMHNILDHMKRGKGDDHEKSNIAADYECNITLALEAATLLKMSKEEALAMMHGNLKSYVDEKYKDMGYEAIYNDPDCEEAFQKYKKMKSGDMPGNSGDSGQSGSGSEGGSGSNNEQHSADWEAGWKKAKADYEAGLLDGSTKKK